MSETHKIKAALCGNEQWQIDRVYGLGRRARLEAVTSLHPQLVTGADFFAELEALQDVEVLFSTWGMDLELARMVSSLPKLKAFFYAAGSVQAFARPLLAKNIVLVSAWAANAVPVAQFAFSQVLLSFKGYFRNLRETRRPENRGRKIETPAPGVFQDTVALLGLGKVGMQVAEMLRSTGVTILVFDPFLSDAEAKSLDLRKVGLEEAFATAYVVSNHLADLPATKGLLKEAHFASMREGATFINTGRGATVVEGDLAAVLKRRSDLTALLDVTFPEPPTPDSHWYGLENAHISSHIAGSLGDEVVRLADYCLEEFQAWRVGLPLKYRVTLEMLEKMA